MKAKSKMTRFVEGIAGDAVVPALRWKYGNETYDIADRGSIGYIAGARGSYKSTLAGALVASALNEEGYMGFNYTPNGKIIAFVDTEMPMAIWSARQEEILTMSGLEKLPSNYHAYNMVDITDAEEKKYEFFKFVKANREDLDMIIIDGLADLVADESNIKEANDLMAYLVGLAKNSNCLIWAVSHTNSSEQLLNHLGKKLGRKSRIGYILRPQVPYGILVPDKVTLSLLPVSEFEVTEDKLLKQGQYIPFGIYGKEALTKF